MKYLIAWVLTIVSTAAPAASFDCAKAGSFAEKTVCADPLLSRLDDALAENFKSMLASDFGNTQASLRQDQKRWLAQRNKCATTKCLFDLYRQRVDDTCEYGVVSGVHPACVMSEDVK